MATKLPRAMIAQINQIGTIARLPHRMVFRSFYLRGIVQIFIEQVAAAWTVAQAIQTAAVT
jgi:hypothetical protein